LEEFLVITFKSTHFALKTEKILKDLNYSFKLIPTPRNISSNCGLAIRIKKIDKEEILNILRSEEVEIEGFYKL
jgi:hypothetical protein